MLGLWYIILITLGMSLFLTAMQNLRKPHRRALIADVLLCRRWRKGAAGGGGGGADEGLAGGDEGAVCEVGVPEGLEKHGKKGAASPGLPGVAG